jgi:hypothetical protein
MSWYRCSGCGPSQKCDICGATQCAQNLSDDCPGCKKAKEDAKGTPPWNMRHQPKGVRPWKHNRKWINRARRHSKKFREENRRWALASGMKPSDLEF